MNYEEYKRLKEAIEKDCKKKLEALEMVWSMSREEPNKQGSSDEHPKRSISDAIRKVVGGMSGEFTADDIVQGLKDHGFEYEKRVQVTNTLHRLLRKKEIEVAKHGAGRVGSSYRKIKKTEPPI